MKTVDPTHAKDSYTSVDVVKYFENIYARNFHGQSLPGFTPQLIDSLQKLFAEYKEGVMKIDPTY
jgi:hypothetical protein